MNLNQQHFQTFSSADVTETVTISSSDTATNSGIAIVNSIGIESNNLTTSEMIERVKEMSLSQPSCPNRSGSVSSSSTDMLHSSREESNKEEGQLPVEKREEVTQQAKPRFEEHICGLGSFSSSDIDFLGIASFDKNDDHIIGDVMAESRLPALSHLRPTAIRISQPAVGMFHSNNGNECPHTHMASSPLYHPQPQQAYRRKSSPTNRLLQKMMAEKHFRPHSPTDLDAHVTPRSIIKLRLSKSASMEDDMP